MQVLIADHADMLRTRLVQLVSALPNIAQVHEAADYMAMQQIVRRERPAIVLMDMFISGGNAPRALSEFFKGEPHCQVIVLMNNQDDRLAAHCLENGALSVFLKSEELIDAAGMVGKLADTRLAG